MTTTTILSLAAGFGSRAERGGAQQAGASAQAGRFATAAQRRARAVAATSNARRSDRKGAELQARGQERRTPERSATVTRSPSSGAAPAASVEAVAWFGSEGASAQRHALASEGERAGTASARPCGPGRARRSGGEGARAAGRPTGAGSPTRRAASSASDCRSLAAVEASPAACRAQRRAGALSAGADVTERSNAERRNNGDGGLDARRLPRPTLRAQAVRPARPLPTGPQDALARLEGGSRGRVRSKRSAELARPVPLGSLCDVA
jgi:hypothetical protein